MVSSYVNGVTIKTIAVLVLFSLCSAAQPTNNQCKPGEYMNNKGACVKCSPGSYSWGGNFNACLKCAPNTYTPYHGVVDSSLCLSCPSGSISPPGSATCFKVGLKKPSFTSSSPPSNMNLPPRTRCGKFYIPPPTGVSYFSSSVCVSPVNGCPRGMVLKVWARKAVCMSNKSRKVQCPKGHVYDSVDRCVSCPSGSVLVKTKKGKRTFRCERCRGNSVSKGGLQKMCTKCKCGFVRNSIGSTCMNTVPKGKSIKC